MSTKPVYVGFPPTKSYNEPLTHEIRHFPDVGKVVNHFPESFVFLEKPEDAAFLEHEEACNDDCGSKTSKTEDSPDLGKTEEATVAKKSESKKNKKKKKKGFKGSEKQKFKQRGGEGYGQPGHPNNVLHKRTKNKHDAGKFVKGRNQRGSQYSGGGNEDSESEEDDKKRRDKFGRYAGIPENDIQFEDDDDDDDDEDDNDDDDDVDYHDEDYNDDHKNEKSDVSMQNISVKSYVSMKSAHASFDEEKKPDLGRVSQEGNETCILLDSAETVHARYKMKMCKTLSTSDLALIDRVISNWLVHSSYVNDCKCPKTGLSECKLTKMHLQHFREGRCGKLMKDCPLCQRTSFSIYLHSRICKETVDDCRVHKCRDFKEMFENALSKRKYGSTVLHSVTTLWKRGQVLNQDLHYAFLFEKTLGKGKFGTVNRVWFHDLNKGVEADIAVKMARYDLTNEAKVHQRIREDHPNILSSMAVISFNREIMIDGSADPIKGYVLMERAECTLFRLKNCCVDRHFPLNDAIYYTAQIFDGLAFLHSKGVIHKDIKDMNILVTEGGQRVKIADWDSAVILEDEMTGRLRPQGTFGHAAPEVMNSEPHSTPADVYSTSVTFLEIAFGGQYRQKIGDKVESLEQYNERRERKMQELLQLHPLLHALIAQCMEVDQHRRPTARDVRNNPIFTLESSYKAQVPKYQSSPSSDPNTKIDPLALLDIAGGNGEFVRRRMDEIESLEDTSILALMDQLPKKLPTENIPVSNDWVGNACAPVEEMDYSS